MTTAAERRIGELLEPKRGRPEKVPAGNLLSDQGISKKESSEFQKLASIPALRALEKAR